MPPPRLGTEADAEAHSNGSHSEDTPEVAVDLASAHTGPQPKEDDALPPWAQPVALLALLVWHGWILVRSVCAQLRSQAWPRSASHSPLLPSSACGPEEALDTICAIGKASRTVPWVKGERSVVLPLANAQDGCLHGGQEQTFKVPSHMAVAVCDDLPQDPKVLVRAMQRYAYAAAQAGVSRMTWSDPNGLVSAVYPTPSEFTLLPESSARNTQFNANEPASALPQGKANSSSVRSFANHVAPRKTTKTTQAMQGDQKQQTERTEEDEGRVHVSIYPHGFPRDEPDAFRLSPGQGAKKIQVALLSSYDGKASLARLATQFLSRSQHLPQSQSLFSAQSTSYCQSQNESQPPLRTSPSHSSSHPADKLTNGSSSSSATDASFSTSQPLAEVPKVTCADVDQLWIESGGISPPQVLLLKPSPRLSFSPEVHLAQLPNFPPWVIGLTELVSLDTGWDVCEADVLIALRQLAGAGQRFGR